MHLDKDYYLKPEDMVHIIIYLEWESNSLL